MARQRKWHAANALAPNIVFVVLETSSKRKEKWFLYCQRNQITRAQDQKDTKKKQDSGGVKETLFFVLGDRGEETMQGLALFGPLWKKPFFSGLQPDNLSLGSSEPLWPFLARFYLLAAFRGFHKSRFVKKGFLEAGQKQRPKLQPNKERNTTVKVRKQRKPSSAR